MDLFYQYLGHKKGIYLSLVQPKKAEIKDESEVSHA